MTNAAVPAVPVPANLIARDDKSKILDDQYLIFAETSYLYQPAVGYIMAKAGVPPERRVLHAPTPAKLRLLQPRNCLPEEVKVSRSDQK